MLIVMIVIMMLILLLSPLTVNAIEIICIINGVM